MLGNVWEWTADAYEDTYANASTDGNVAVKGKVGSPRVMRGGSWSSNARLLRSGLRGNNWPSDRSDDVGFRLVRTAE